MPTSTLTIEKAAKELGRSIYSVRTYCEKNMLEAENIGNARYKVWRIPVASIAKFKKKYKAVPDEKNPGRVMYYLER